MLTFDLALRMAATVLAEGERRGSAPLTVAVLDAGGHQVVLHRQDGAGIARPQIAIGKAWGALGVGFSSRGIADAAARFPAFFDALAVASDGRVIPAAGGVLLRAPGQGVVGRSGSAATIRTWTKPAPSWQRAKQGWRGNKRSCPLVGDGERKG
ncbi:heme-binding protein [Amycolatopsis sp. NPDC051106]|uniref:GlcG/HbpS family heme-binding protein n=1 Tax=unclassified Amycolatopsis TaxID=2618356 RepID=UPI00342A7FE6